MKISEQLEAIAEALKEWADPIGADVAIASNLRDLWRTASMESQKPRVLVTYIGKHMRGGFGTSAILGLADRTFNVAVTRGRGFAVNRGDTLTKKVGNADPFYDCLEAAELVIRNLEGVSQEFPVDFKGDKAMQLGNLVVDGYIIEFSTANDEEALTTKGN